MTATIDQLNTVFESLKKNTTSIETKSFERFKKMGYPTRHSEVYKYSNLNHFKKLIPNIDGRVPHKLPDYFTHQYLQDKNLLVTVNGVFVESLSQYEEEDGIIISCMCDARKDFRDIVTKHYNETQKENPDAFSELNTAFSQCGIFIYAKKNAVAKKPIVVMHLGYQQEKDTIACQRNLIVVEENAKVEIIEDYLNLADDADFNINHFSEYFINDNAQVDVSIYQEESNHLHFIGNKFFELARDSRLQVNTLNISGRFVRNNFRVNINGENSEATINGVFINENNDHTDNRLFIRHNAPHCQSFQNFKGILNDSSSGVFNGKIYVAEGAQKTNAFQNNKNVLLSEDAIINTKPELEIYANDVKCSHGATSGQLDDNAIFYAETRGIPKDKAKKLIVFAFAQEVVQQIHNEAFRDFIERRLVNKLQLNEYSTSEVVQSNSCEKA